MDTVTGHDGKRQPETLYHGDALDVYKSWPAPSCIMSDGAYGIGGFPGDPRDAEALPAWYEPHLEAWSAAATPATTLWFWGTALGVAEMHQTIKSHGWSYVQTLVWDKGVSHVAGRTNSKTAKVFPVASEFCVMYERACGTVKPSEKVWLRNEWARSGLAYRLANEACGVIDVASRKYLTLGPEWLRPTGAALSQMAAYCNSAGEPGGRPYFSLDGEESVSAGEWEGMRHKWTHTHGMTDVWRGPPVRGSDRLGHPNQKPSPLIEILLRSVTSVGDVVWEPFGGSGTASVVSLGLGLAPYAAEVSDKFYPIMREQVEAVRLSRQGVLAFG